MSDLQARCLSIRLGRLTRVVMCVSVLEESVDPVEQLFSVQGSKKRPQHQVWGILTAQALGEFRSILVRMLTAGNKVNSSRVVPYLLPSH